MKFNSSGLVLKMIKKIKKKISRNKFHDNVRIECQDYKKTPFPCIEVCLKFQNPGKHIIDLTSLYTWLSIYEKNAFRFYFDVNSHGEEKCISHVFNELNEEVLFNINNMKKGIQVHRLTKPPYKDSEQPEMIFDCFLNDAGKELIAEIQPLFDEERYKFSNPDIVKVNKGKEKIDETNTSKKGRNNLEGKMKGGSSSGDKEDIRGKGIMVEIEDKIDDEAKDELEDNAEDDTESEIETKSNNDNSRVIDKLRKMLCWIFK